MQTFISPSVLPSSASSVICLPTAATAAAAAASVQLFYDLYKVTSDRDAVLAFGLEHHAARRMGLWPARPQPP